MVAFLLPKNQTGIKYKFPKAVLAALAPLRQNTRAALPVTVILNDDAAQAEARAELETIDQFWPPLNDCSILKPLPVSETISLLKPPTNLAKPSQTCEPLIDPAAANEPLWLNTVTVFCTYSFDIIFCPYCLILTLPDFIVWQGCLDTQAG